MIKILVLFDSSAEFSRRFLKGLIRYSMDYGPWSFYRLPAYYRTLYGDAGILERIREWEIDAVIAQWENEDVSFLEQLDIPVFLQTYRDPDVMCSKISGDYKKVGAMAADFFVRKRFRNFAFYGHNSSFWSKKRAEGFREEVEKNGGNFFYFESEPLNETEWSGSHAGLDDWLRALPKPVGLLACDDGYALQISEMCKVNNIDIPNELSLLGVDNDELICNLSYPSISSVVTDDKNGGYTAGKMLHRQIQSKTNNIFNISINPVRIELRQSTEKYNVSNKAILDAVNYIDANFMSDLSIEELTGVVPLSRRNLEIKFKEEMGTSIYRFILDNKVGYISHQLLVTNKSPLEIALEVGYKDVRNIYRLFKKSTGYTPIDFRKKFKDKTGGADEQADEQF